MADDLPPGVHLTADGRVAAVVFEGAGPDEAVMVGLEARLASSGQVITSAASPGRVPSPLADLA